MPTIAQQPHYRLSSPALADWLDRKVAGTWWTVDGDTRLMEVLNFPCPSDELAAELRRLDRPLLLLAPPGRPDAGGEEVGGDELEGLSMRDEYGYRVFQLAWADTPDVPWILSEDPETQQASSSSSSARSE